MKKLIFFPCLIVFVSCAAQQPAETQEEPKGEYQYFPISSFFQDKKQEEITFEKRQAHLNCENEKLSIAMPAIDGTSVRARNFSATLYNRALKARNTFYDNCMELKGFEKVWVPFNQTTTSVP